MSADAKPILYHSIYMCSSRPLAVIHEMGIEDKVDVKVICDHAELKKPEFLALNPHGTLPILILPGGQVMLESGAISLYLVEKYGGADHRLLGPASKRAELLMWLFYVPCTIYPQLGAGFSQDEAKKNAAKEKLETVILPYVVKHLGDKQFLLGDTYTLADLFLAYELGGLHYLNWLDAAKFPTLAEYCKRTVQNEAWNKAWATGNAEAHKAQGH